MNARDVREAAHDLESLVRECFEDLTAAESALVRVASKGEPAVCGLTDDLSDSSNDPKKADAWGKERHIRAGLIAWLCLDRRASGLIHPKGLQVLGAVVPDALDLSFVTIGFPLVLAGCRLRKELHLPGARTRTISLQGSQVHSLFADGVVVSGALLLRDGFHSEGGVQLTGATIDGPFDCSGSTFENIASGPAIVADGAVVNSYVFLRRGFRASGEVRFPHARVSTDFDCTQGTFTAKLLDARQLTSALNLEGIVVGGSVFLRGGFRAQGMVLLHGAQVEFNLDCVGGRFENPAQQGVSETGTALNFDASVVKGTVILSDHFCASGLVRLISAQISGDLRCTAAYLGNGLIAERASIGGTLFWRDILSPSTSNLNVIGTSADSLSDDAASWPGKGNLQLDGFVYRRFSAFSPRGARERLDWLSRVKSLTPQPFRQLANALTDRDERGSRRVLYEMARLRDQENQGVAARIWSFMFRHAAGYGYYPGRALWCLIGLTVIGFGLFFGGYRVGSIVPTDKDTYYSFKCCLRVPDYYERFHASIYSLENSFPVVKFGQADHWQPDPSSSGSAWLPTERPRSLTYAICSPAALRVFRWVQILLGWFFATLGLGAVTGLVRRD